VGKSSDLWKEHSGEAFTRKEKWKVAVTGGAGQHWSPHLATAVNDRAVSSVVCLDLHPPRLKSSRNSSRRFADLRTADLEHLFMGCNVVHPSRLPHR